MSLRVSINAQWLKGRRGCSLFQCGEQAGIHIPTSCYKNGKCRECLVEVVEGENHLTPHSSSEKHLDNPFRLSCQARISSNEGTIKCHTMRRGELKIEETGHGLPSEIQTIDPAVTQRDGMVFIDDNPIDQFNGSLHGLAIDLGTTTIVLRLHDLESGVLLATQSFENPQRFGGSDVMARIRYDTDHRGRLLQRTLLGYLSHAIEKFNCDPASIYEVVIAGNSTMRDLFFGLDVYSIGQKPYQSLTEKELNRGQCSSTSLTVEAKKLRLPTHPRARVYGLPLIKGHVGGDATACLLATLWTNECRLIALLLVQHSKVVPFLAACQPSTVP